MALAEELKSTLVQLIALIQTAQSVVGTPAAGLVWNADPRAAFRASSSSTSWTR